MPSALHEWLITLFRTKLDLLVHCLRPLGYPIPPYTEMTLGPTDLSQPQEFRPDQVILLNGEHGDPVCAFVLEVQLQWDSNKLWTWMAYGVNLMARLRIREVFLVIVTPDTYVAQRSQEGFWNDQLHWKPYVLGPTTIPKIRTIEEVIACPEMAMLSAIAHASGEDGWAVVKPTMEGILQLDTEEVPAYAQGLWEVLPERMKSHVEAMINQQLDVWKMPLEQMTNPLAKLLLRWKEEGKTEGKVEGEVCGETKTLLMILETKGWELSTAQREQVFACTDISLLDRWVRKAVLATSLEQVFTS